MVRNNKRRAFTIVELVIVIAVIAILAAVMIPTFGGIIKRANISADTQIAASMNTQLSIYKAEGKKIETEADLWAALKSDADFTSQLDPKSAKHGYHFWYIPETQEVKLLSYNDLAAQGVFSAGGLDIGFAETAPRSFVNGYYFLDKIVEEKGNNEIASFFAAIEEMAEFGADYIAEIEKLDGVEGDNETLANALIERMMKTVVVNNNGFYYQADATNAYYYFVEGTTTIKATQHVLNGNSTTLPTPANNQIVLPSTVISVEKDALNFATANSVTVVTSYASSDVLAAALASGCSNAIFTTTDGNAYVVENENELHVNGGEFKCYLKKRLPFSDFTIALSNDGGNLYKQVGDTIYVLITNAGEAQLYAQDPATGATSNEIDSWTSNNTNIKIESDGRIDFVAADITTTNNKAVLTATAINDKLETVERTINVEIVKATGASIRIDGKDYVLGDGKNHQLTLTYDATTTYDVTLKGASYSTEAEVEIGTNSITIVPGNDSIVSVANNTLSLTPGKSDNTFVVSIDECLKTTFYVNLIDASLAEFTHTFKKSSTEVRPFYVGTGSPIKLSSLFKFKGADEDFAGAKITIYDQDEKGQFYMVYEINNTENNLDAVYPREIETLDDWKTKTITFSFANREGEKRPATNDVYIEITGSNNYSIILKVVLVEGATNVAGEDFQNLGTVSTNVVLNGDATVTPGKKITLGANTLYGNGYIIDAKQYTGSGVGDYFISVNGGTIDNVYIDGPVYPTFEYTTSTLGYHVSGIKAEGTSTVQNSYVSNFRQPIALQSGTLNVTNTTLYGGNYANLQVNGGTLNLTDVTTVQPEDGISDTFGKGKNVVGLGIVVEYSAVKDSNTSTINVNGYLDQYNWISYNTTADLPVFEIDGSKMDFKVILSAMFKGVDIAISESVWGYEIEFGRIQKKLAFLDHYFYENDTYLNTGIIFITLGVGSDASTASGLNANFKVQDNRKESESSEYVSYRKLEGTNLPLFSGYKLMEKAGIKVTAGHAMRLLYKLTIDETGKAVGSVGLEAIKAILSTPIDAYIRVWSYRKPVEGEVTDFGPTEYTQGYYVNYGK